MQRRLARQPLEFQPRTARLELAKEDVPARIIWYQRWDINSKPKIAVPNQVLGDRCGCLSPPIIRRPDCPVVPRMALGLRNDERDNARRGYITVQAAARLSLALGRRKPGFLTPEGGPEGARRAAPSNPSLSARNCRYPPYFGLAWLWDRAATERDNARRVRR